MKSVALQCLLFISFLFSARAGGLNHYRRNGQLPRKTQAHSSVVNALNRNKHKILQDLVNKTWDRQLYEEGKSVVDDESDLTRLLMSGASLADSEVASAQLLVDGQVIAGAGKPALPEEYFELPIPRRPRWTRAMTKSELAESEQAAFVAWRRRLSHIEDAYEAVITPYEKSPFFWRQLWRVVERGDVVVQVLDCRDPLLYRSRPLEDLVSSCGDLGGDSSDEGAPPGFDAGVGPDFGQRQEGAGSLGLGAKVNVVLLNKADLLPREARTAWARFWRGQGMPFFFFSALQAEGDGGEVEGGGEGDGDRGPALWSGEEESEEEEEGERTEEVDEGAERTRAEEAEEEEEEEEGAHRWEEEEEEEEDGAAVLCPEDLLFELRELAVARRQQVAAAGRGGRGADSARRATISFVGFPNVGKSSVLNALTAGFGGVKRVAQAASPGKTKHLQTLLVGDDLVLCDCPGLVFPSVVSCRAEMVCASILSLHNLRDPLPPIQLVCDRVPKQVLEELYGIAIKAKIVFSKAPKDPLDFMRAARVERLGGAGGVHAQPSVREGYDAVDLLQAYSAKRGMVQQNSGNPDVNRAARVILKDFITGRIPHWREPPDIMF